ncbi:hypothetical protein K470DRAFT_268907 [Piedraia hortae CBS 480.64]|uniref:Gag1-like clamp domain-containing protein n=1 Tax=Piedraia hortae CBS 480.64 TaxID=1314780 RepID=A0A6A7C5Q7_9PEZI|nr:hypothetical protein K470DRAFT_268907 [Piedraia hortae CBS 480.64]
MPREVDPARRWLKENTRSDWAYPDPPRAEAPTEIERELNALREPPVYRARELSEEEEEPVVEEDNEGLKVWLARRDAWTGARDGRVPVAPPILVGDPRREIYPDAYLDIYSKIIVQGRTPTVPINLATFIHAVVAGWKADGQWPLPSVFPAPPETETKGPSTSDPGGFRWRLSRALGFKEG